METKKLLRNVIVAILFSLTSIQLKAATYVYCGVGSITALSSWSLTACGGTNPASFTNAGDVWNFNTAGSYTLTANWTLGSNAKINVGSGGAAVTLVTNGKTIKTTGAINITLAVLANGVLNVGLASQFAGANKLTLDASTAGNTVIFSVASSTIPNVNYSNLSFTASNTLNISTTITTFTNSATATINSAALTIGTVVNTGTITMGAGGTSLAISTDLNNTGGVVTIGNSGVVTINGTITNFGTVRGDGTGTLRNAGATNATLTMDATNNSMFEVLNTGAGGITVGSALVIAAGGDITPGAGTINLGSGLVTLSASKGSSAAIGQVGGTLSGGPIISNVYHNPNGNATQWTTMGSAGVTNATFAMWETAFPITCSVCTYTGSGGSPFTSVYSYNEQQTGGGDYTNAAHYVEIGGDNATIVNGAGYWVYMGNTMPGNPTPAEAITVTGTPAQGNIPVTITKADASNGYNLLANPYPSPISWSALVTNNPGITNNTCYIYNAADGSYGTMNSVGTASGTYGLNDDVIPTGMAFYVLSSAASSTFNFDEIVKIPGGVQDLQRSAAPKTQSQNSLIPRFSLEATGPGMKGSTLFAFDSRAAAGFDNIIDAPYLLGTESLRVTSVEGTKDLSINGKPNLTQNYSIPVKIVATTTGTYSVNAANFRNMLGGACLILHDNYLNADYDLRQGPHSILITDTEKVARFVLNITTASLSVTTQVTPISCPAGNDGKIIAVGNSAGPWNYIWRDANSNVVRTTTNKASADTLAGVGAGAFAVDVSTAGGCDDGIQSFTLTAPAMPTSAFTVNSNTVLVGNPLNFTGNTTGADGWFWNFGDSAATSTMQNPVYTYTNVGTFDVTLYAINTLCGDTVASMVTSIDVQGTTSVLQHESGDLFVSKDASGAFVKFNYGTETKVSITVYNALGQVLFNSVGTRVNKDKIYLNLEQAHDQMIFISIVNHDANMQVTKKLFNN